MGEGWLRGGVCDVVRRVFLARARYTKSLSLPKPPSHSHPHPTPTPTQDALIKEAPVVYNKEELLNPAFIVFGRRRPDA